MRRSDFRGGRHLLNTINGKPANKPERTSDPSVSSEDKSSEPPPQKRALLASDRLRLEASEDDDDDSDGKADISMERTDFGKANGSERLKSRWPKTTASASSSSSRRDFSGPTAKRRKMSSDEDGDELGEKENKKEQKKEKKASKESSSSAISKTSKPPPTSSFQSKTSQEDPYFGDRKHKKVFRSYSRNQSQSSGKTKFKKSPRELASDEGKSVNVSTPHGGSYCSQSGAEAEVKRSTFMALPSDDNIASPQKKRPQFKMVGDSEASNTESPPATFRAPSSSAEPSGLQSQSSSQTERIGPNKSLSFRSKFSNPPLKKKKKKKLKGREDEEEKAPAAVFKTFDDEDLEPSNDNAGLSDDEDSSHEGFDKKGSGNVSGDNEKLPKPVTLCPWCGDEVDEQLLKESSRGKRMNVRQQTKFCRRHKKHTAMKTWNSQGYPEIDWDELPHRIVSHYDTLLDIVDGKNVDGRKSYYRELLAEKIEAGESRSLKKEENLNPGYYGPKGFNLMCDRLVHKFSDLLKERAVKDRVISGRGSAAFIQAVLVAELAILLIMDDMPNMPYDKAREVMEESKAIGEIVNEDI